MDVDALINKLCTEPRLDGAEELSWIEVPDRFDVLASLVSHKHWNVRSCAVRALSYTGDPRAVDIFASIYDKDPDNTYLIGLLGNLGGSAALAFLHGIVRDRFGDPRDERTLESHWRLAVDGDPADLQVLAEAVESFAKLGDFSFVGIACRLTEFRRPDDGSDDAADVRNAAITALDVSVGSGIADVLERCCHDPHYLVGPAAMDALLDLGRVRAMETWLRAYDTDDVVDAMSCIKRLIGERPPESGLDAARWWLSKQHVFDPNICYRLGQPSSPAVLLPTARGDDIDGTRIELQQMTGLPFIAPLLKPAPAAETAAIDEWWAKHGATFVPGKLHRWGRTYEPSACD